MDLGKLDGHGHRRIPGFEVAQHRFWKAKLAGLAHQPQIFFLADFVLEGLAILVDAFLGDQKGE